MITYMIMFFSWVPIIGGCPK